MPSKTEWRDLEQGIGRDAFKLGGTRNGSAGAILIVWLAFYVLAVTHSLLSQRTAVSIASAEAQTPSHVESTP